MQKVSKKENTTKIFLKLSFFGNISVCVVAVKAVYWGTGPVSGVSAAAATAWDRPADEVEQLPLARNQLPPHTHTCAPSFLPHKFPAKLEKEKNAQFLDTYNCWNVFTISHLAF